MSVDLLKKLGIGVAVLVVLWTGSELLRGGPDSGQTDLEIPEVTAQDIDSILIQYRDDTIRLTRVDSTWRVNGFEANESVSELVGAVSGGFSKQLVGQNPDMHERFSIDEASARHLRLYRGDDAIFDMLVGKQGTDFQNVFVRNPGEDEVYSVRSRISSFMTRAVNDWRNKVIARIEADDVRRIEVRRGRSSYTLARPDSVWMIDGEEANPGGVSTLINQFGTLNALGFASDAAVSDSIDLESPDRAVELFGAGDVSLLEITLDSMPNGFWAQRSGNDVVFRMDLFKVNQITPSDSTVRN